MLKYIYMPTKREVWCKLAQHLLAIDFAKPVIWIGDRKVENQAKQLVDVDGVVVKFIDIHTSFTAFQIELNGDELGFMGSKEGLIVKNMVIKMMDRHDPYGAYRYMDRDLMFKNFVLYSFFLIKKYKPDFLLMAESPHSPFQYVLYEVAKFSHLKSFSFCSLGILPLSFIREGISGEPIEVNVKLPFDYSDYIESAIDQFIQPFTLPEGDIEPKYMKKQKQFDVDLKLTRKIKNLLSLFVSSAKILSGNPRHSLDRGLFNNTRLAFIEPFFNYLVTHMLSKNLISEYKNSITINLPLGAPFVYFPLHYEPERTTNPDGGEFYDQIDAIMALRCWLPSSIPLVLKEHYSQFTSALVGYKGRDKGFYKLLKNIDGIVFVDPSHSSRDLIERACLTATITGTAALQAAMLGKKGMVFGNPWFAGCPNISQFKKYLTYEDFLTKEPSMADSLIDVKSWLKCIVEKKSIILGINPGNKRYHADFYRLSGVIDVEYKVIGDVVVNVLSDSFSVC